MGSSSMDEQSDVDVDDELLELAFDVDDNDSVPHRKRAASSSIKARNAKRRKHDLTADTDDESRGGDEPESEEDESNPYPLDGKFKDETDRQKLMMMPELEREAILSQRLEEKQRHLDKVNIRMLLNANRKHSDSPDVDAVSSAAKRKHTTVGKTAEKAKGLAALAEKRRNKKERDARHDDADYESPKKASRRQMSEDASSEDGEVSKRDTDSRDHGTSEMVLVEDLSMARITRDMLEKACHRKDFEDFVVGGWVKYHFGLDEYGKPSYALCEIINVGAEFTTPYKLGEKVQSDKTLELRHAEKVKTWNMDRVSNAPFDKMEFQTLVRHLQRNQMRLPRRRDLEKKRDAIKKFLSAPISDADTQTSIADHSRMRGGRLTMPEQLAKKARLGQRRALAQKQKNEQELAQVGQEIADLEAQYPALRAATEVVSDRTSTIVEKNRLAALKERRENEEAERDARRRKALGAAAGGGSSDVSRPGTPTVKDLSARVKTVSRLGQDADSSRSGTPKPEAQAAALPGAPSVMSSLNAVASAIDLDLGDF